LYTLLRGTRGGEALVKTNFKKFKPPPPKKKKNIPKYFNQIQIISKYAKNPTKQKPKYSKLILFNKIKKIIQFQGNKKFENRVNDLLEPGDVTEPGLLVALPPQAEDLVQLVDPVLYGVLDGS
jgi:hypothetical protein